MGKWFVGVGLFVGLVGGAMLIWQLRPSTLRYQGTFDGVIEWHRLQRDQWLTALLVVVSLVLQIVGLFVVQQSESPVRASACEAATFALPKAIGGLVPTGEATTGSYRSLRVGMEAVVASGAGVLVLVRGVPNYDFIVSAFSHGPTPLVPVVVMGQPALLYPKGDTSRTASYVPFEAGPNRGGNACNRWELRGYGMGDEQLLAYAQAVQAG